MRRSIGDVRKYIFEGFENLNIDINREGNVESMVSNDITDNQKTVTVTLLLRHHHNFISFTKKID